jgi:hypothetical protein
MIKVFKDVAVFFCRNNWGEELWLACFIALILAGWEITNDSVLF